MPVACEPFPFRGRCGPHSGAPSALYRAVPRRQIYMFGRPAAAEIFEGITYGCKQLEPSEEARGDIHWVRIDLTTPGITPYVTGKDPTAVSQGWQYRLRRVSDVVAREHLAVAINGTLFRSEIQSIGPNVRRPGQRRRTCSGRSHYQSCVA